MDQMGAQAITMVRKPVHRSMPVSPLRGRLALSMNYSILLVASPMTTHGGPFSSNRFFFSKLKKHSFSRVHYVEMQKHIDRTTGKAVDPDYRGGRSEMNHGGKRELIGLG